MNGESKVEVITREGWRKEYPLRKGIVYIGSAASNDIVLNGMQGGGVAPLHAQLIANQAGYKLINLAEAEIRLGEAGGDVLPPRAVIDMVDGLTFGLGEFTLVFRGSGGGYDLGATSGSGTRFIGLRLAMPYVRLAPHQSLDGKVIVQNLGGKTGVRFDIDLEGLDTDCYDVAPGPLLSSGAQGEVLFRIHHRGLKPLAGAWTITLRATAPRDYPGEEAVVSQQIEVLPFYRHQLRLFAPGSAPETIEPQDFLTPKAKSGSLTDQEESRTKGKKGKWWTAHPSWGDEQEPVRMRAKPAPTAKPAKTAATTPAESSASADSEEEPWGWQAKETDEASGRADARPVVVAGEGEWGQAEEAEEAAPPPSPEPPAEPEPVEKKSEGDVSTPAPPVAAIPPQTPPPAPPPEKVAAVREPVTTEPEPSSDDKPVVQPETVQSQSAVEADTAAVAPKPVGTPEPVAADTDVAETEKTAEMGWWQRLNRTWPFGRRAEPVTEETRQADEDQAEVVDEPQAALSEPTSPPATDEVSLPTQAPVTAVETPQPDEVRMVIEPEPGPPVMEAEAPMPEVPAEEADEPTQTMPAVPPPAGADVEMQPTQVEAETASREAGSEPPEADKTAAVVPDESLEPPPVAPEPEPDAAAVAHQPDTDDEVSGMSDFEPEPEPVKTEAVTAAHQPDADEEVRETPDNENEPERKPVTAEAATAAQSEAEDEVGETSDVEAESKPDENEDRLSDSEPAPAATTKEQTEGETEAEDWLAFEEKKERKVIKLRADTASLPVQKKEKQSEIEELWTAD